MTARVVDPESPNRPLDVLASYGALALGVSGLVLGIIALVV